MPTSRGALRRASPRRPGGGSRRTLRSPQPDATPAGPFLETNEATLLDVIDSVLSRGVVLSGDLTIALADVNLVYAQFSLLLCAADRVLPNETTDFMERHHTRHMLRIARRVARRLDSTRRSAKREGE